MAQETPTKITTRLYLAILPAIFVSIMGYNSWTTQQNAARFAPLVKELTQEMRRLSDLLTETRVAHGNRITAVERDVEGLDRRVTRLEDE